MRIISLSKSGKSGQPLAAKKLVKELSPWFEFSSKTINDEANFILRLKLCISVSFQLWRTKEITINHLSFESIFFHLFFVNKKVISIQHGLFDFANADSYLRAFQIWIYKKSIKRGNQVFFVNDLHSKACGSNNVLSNTVEISGLPSKEKLNAFRNIGFVGRNSRQKNILSLKETISRFPTKKFFHLSNEPLDEFLYFSNYYHIASTERYLFFDTIDCLLIPSKWESFCLVAYEGAYSGCVVLHSGNDGLSMFDLGYSIERYQCNSFSDFLTLAEERKFTAIPYSFDQSKRNNEILKLVSLLHSVKEAK